MTMVGFSPFVPFPFLTLFCRVLFCLVLTICAVKKFDDYDRYMAPRGVKPGHIFDQFLPVQDIKEKLAKIRGHLVWMPLKFLEETEMADKGLQVNQFTESVYT